MKNCWPCRNTAESDSLNLDNVPSVTDGAHVTFGDGCPAYRSMQDEYLLLASCVTAKYRPTHPKLVIV